MALLLAGSVAAGLAVGVDRILPSEGHVARGLIVDGIPVGDGESIEAVVARRVAARLGREVRLVHDGETVLTTDLGSLGATVDAAAFGRAAGAVGRVGSLWQRLDDALQARQGRSAVHLSAELPLERLAAALERLKVERDQHPRPARWDFAADVATAHADGLLIDLHETARAIELAAPGDSRPVTVATRRVAPRATTAVVTAID